MTAPPDMQADLRTLSIRKEQRPSGGTVGRRGGRLGRLAIAVFLLGLAIMAYLGWDRLGGGSGPLAGGSVPATAVRLLKVKLAPMPEPPPVLTATGKIVSDHRVAVATKVSGQIVALFFEQGDRVAQGQILARIEDVLYRARRDEAAARLERSVAHLAFQKVNFERVSRLAASESAPDIEFADAKRALDEAQAIVEAEQATLNFAQKTLSDCEVVAPIPGVILARNVEVGDFVAAEGGRGAMANAQFAVIADMTKLRVEVDISELDIVRIRDDMPCVITPDAYKDRRYHGHVMWLDPGANYSKATVQVKVRIAEPDDYLRVEGSALVAFLSADSSGPKDETATDRSGPRMWIPTSACLLGPTGLQGVVFVVVDGRFRQTPISIGQQEGDQLEVTSGLVPGQSIALDGVGGLTDGQRVR